MKIKRVVALAAIFLFSATASADELEWTHHDQEKWGATHDSSQTTPPLMYPFAVCSIGQHQSPVDLASASVSNKLNKLRIHYPPDVPAFYNSGHGVQVNFSEHYDGRLSVGHEAYPLIQLHFHEPSEHVIGSRKFPAELHFVHVREDGKIAVLGVLIEIGEENPVFQSILENIPYTGGESNQTANLRIHPEKLLPRNTRHFYTVAGSLTTPPCSEGVDWYILSNIITVSESQLVQLKSFYADNARQPQALNDRVVAEKR